MTTHTTQVHGNDEQRGGAVFVTSPDGSVEVTVDTERALARVVRLAGRDPSPAAITAAVALAQLRGERTPPDAAMALVDALIHDAAPRATVLAAVAALGAERALPLLRRALRMRRDAASVRDLARAMVVLAFPDAASVSGDARSQAQHLTLATLAQHPTLWASDAAWLADAGLPASREAVAALVANDA